MTTKRKPMLPALAEVKAELMEFWEGDTLCDLARKEIDAAEDVLRALDRVELVPGKAADRLIVAVARLDAITRRTP